MASSKSNALARHLRAQLRSGASRKEAVAAYGDALRKLSKESKRRDKDR